MSCRAVSDDVLSGGAAAAAVGFATVGCDIVACVRVVLLVLVGSAVECGGGESSGGAGDDGEALVDDPDSAIAPWAPARVLVQGAEDSAAANSDSMAV